MSAIYVEITATRGSAPRDAGTAMRVDSHSTQGTIGGGALEYQAVIQARRMLDAGDSEHTATIPLGPNLGQCCGGAVTLRFTPDQRVVDLPAHQTLPKMPAIEKSRLWLWGAGHVGRAYVTLAAPCDAFDITWIDTSTDRFPRNIPCNVTATPASDMPRLAVHAPHEVHHLIFTYSHDIDLSLCAALLKRNAASIGLIGSATKWARFSKRLRDMGLDPTPIICPIGDKTLGKTPAAIASGTLGALLAMAAQKEPA